MKGGLVAAGAVLIILSVGWFLLLPIFPIVALTLCIVSPVLLIVGVILLILGFVLEDEKQVIYMVQQPGAPPMGQYGPSNLCNKCRNQLTWVSQYNRWYCYYCRTYV